MGNSGEGDRAESPAYALLNNSENLAVCKILLESRSMRKDKMIPILDKLIACCVLEGSKRAVTELRANERYHYLTSFLKDRTDFGKRVQFMYGGKLERIQFKYIRLSIEAVLDRLPTVEIISQGEDGWTGETEVFGKGIEMWIRSQGDFILMRILAERRKEG